MDKEHPCCPSNSLPKLDFSGPSKGTITKLSDFNVYTVGDGPKVFIFLYDVAGLYGGRTQLICDQISSFGYTVVLPDILKGDPWKGTDPSSPELYKWLSQINYNTIEEFLLKTLIPDLKKQGKTSFAVGGTCLGAWVGLKLLAVCDEFKAGVSYHPSFKIEEIQGRSIADTAINVKQPHLMIPGQNDPENVKNGGEIVKILEKSTEGKIEVVEMNDVQHGFLVRGDIKNETVLKRVEQSLKLTKEFLAKYL